MVHKKYIIKNGKTYGPYYYESYREGAKVKKRYIKDPTMEKFPCRVNINFVFLVCFFVFLVLLFIIFQNFHGLTGRVLLDIDVNTSEEEIVSGNIQLTLRQGELIPKDSKVLVTLNDQKKEFLLEELVELDSVYGNFYIEGLDISGKGEGYGIRGKEIQGLELVEEFGVINDLKNETEETTRKGMEEDKEVATAEGLKEEGEEDADVVDEKERSEEIEEEQEIVEEEKFEDIEESGGTEDVDVAGDTEEKQETVEGEEQSGEVVENVDEADDVEKEPEEEATIIEEPEDEGTEDVDVAGDSEEEGESEESELTITGEIISDLTGSISNFFLGLTGRVSENVEINGFGEEYLGEQKLIITIDLSKFNFTRVSGKLEVEIIYNDHEISSVSEDIFYVKGIEVIEEPITNISTSNLTLIKDIPTIRILKNSNYRINLSEYFAGAENYKLKIVNISGDFNGEILILTPPQDFSGARKGKIIAYLGEKSVESNEFNILVSKGGLKVDSKRGKIKIGEPVKWVVNVSLEVPENITVEITDKAKNISVKKVVGADKEKIDPYIKEGITGKIIFQSEEDSLFGRVFNKLISRITGRVTTDINMSSANLNGSIEIILEDNATGYEIEYETPAPEAFEENISEFNKIITVSGPDDLNYENILSYAEIPELLKVGQEEIIKIFWRENQTDVEFDAYDLDGNDYLDYVEWIVPHLSNQSFEISITILNIQSYPLVGGNWTVMFNTTGVADLKIMASNGTTWTNFSENNSQYDLKFLEIKCGNDILKYDWKIENSSEINETSNCNISNSTCYVFISNYTCNSTSYEISKVLTSGVHEIKFDFGGQIAYAHNSATFMDINFVDPTPVDYFNTSATSVEINVTIDSDEIGNINWTWNSTNYSFYEPDLLFMVDFDKNNTAEDGSGATFDSAYSVWHFEEGAGNLAADSGGQAKTLTAATEPYAPSWDPNGKYGYGINFDGDDYIYRLDDNSFDIAANQSFSVGMWVKTSTTKKSRLYVKGSILDNLGVGLDIYGHTNGGARLEIGDGSNGIGINGDTNVSDGNWHFVIGIRDVASDELRIYVDGAQDATPVTDTTTDSLENSNNLYFGMANAGTLNFTGVMDEAFIIKRVLSTDEILMLNNSRWYNQSYFDGRYKQSYYVFNGSNLSYSTTNNLNNATGTIEMWVKPSWDGDDGQRRIFFESETAGWTNLISLRKDIGNNLVFTIYDDQTDIRYVAASVNSNNFGKNKWHHIISTWDDSSPPDLKLYLDGNLVADTEIGNGTGKFALHPTMFIGADATGFGFEARALIDEVRIYNNTLNAEEVRQHYISNLKKYNSTHWEFYSNQSDEGSHTYQVCVSDANGNLNCTETRSLTIDRTAPNATLLTPENATITLETDINFTANLSDEQGIKNATLFIYNESRDLVYNYTFTFAQGVLEATIGVVHTLTDGVYTWFYEVWDWAGNMFRTDQDVGNYTVTIDTTEPELSIIYPQNTTYSANVSELNYTYTDANSDSCWYSTDSGDTNSTSVLVGTNFTDVISVKGTNTWTLYCNDSVNNLNSTSVTFDVTLSPRIEFVDPTPVDYFNTSATSVEINVTIDKGTSFIDNINWSWNSTNYSFYDNDLVLHMNLDNNTVLGENATLAVDVSKYGNNATFNTSGISVWTSSGKYSGGVEFEGINESIIINHSDQLILGDNGFSVEIWTKMKGNSSINAREVIVYKADVEDSISVRGYKLTCAYLISGPLCTFGYGNGTGSVASGLTSIGNLNTWYHLVGVLNDTAVSIWVNGVLVSFTARRGSYVESNASLWVGNNPSSIGRSFNGTLDELRIYNRSLSKDEIWQHYRSNLAKYNGTHWELYGNAPNLIAGESYNYQAFVSDTVGNLNMTELRHVNINSTAVPSNGGGGGGGSDSCVDECSFEGDLQNKCINRSLLTTLTCGNYDSDSCLEWGGLNFNNCITEGKICVRSKCVEPECLNKEDWNCGDWGKCEQGIQIRTCINKNGGCDIDEIKQTRKCEMCEENWNCTEWSNCEMGITERDCVEVNNCGTEDLKPDESRICAGDVFLSSDGETPCYPNWDCTSWGECEAKYSFKRALIGSIVSQGIQKRECTDLVGCAPKVIEKQDCELRVPITAKSIEWCGQDYAELFEVQSGSFVGRIRGGELLGLNELSKLDILFPLTEFEGYCNYCYDGVQDYDETEVDCGGPNCPECVELSPYVFIFDWVYWVKILLWILFMLSVVLSYLTMSREDKRKIIKKISNSVRYIIVSESKEVASIRQRKVENWFKNVFGVGKKV